MQDFHTQESMALDFIKNIEGANPFSHSFFIDDDVSTSIKMAKRPQLQAMLGALCPDVKVVVYNSDRLSRDVIEMVTIYRQIKQARGYLLSITESGIDDEFMMGLKGVLAQKEKSDIRRRIVDKLSVKKKRGERISRFIPYGYRLDQDTKIALKRRNGTVEWKLGKLHKSESEQEVLHKMQQMAAWGQSFRQIARALTEQGHRTREGKPFQPMTIYRILARTTHKDQIHSPQDSSPQLVLSS
jgi:DNA invertase Pin-like site-specific DNA recombinase